MKNEIALIFGSFNPPTKTHEHYRKNSLDSIREDVPENVYEFLKEIKGVF